VGGSPEEYEQEHVHNVYKAIASHFSSTRYKPWPIIEQFISSLPTGSIGLDSGTGNGKYLPLPAHRSTDVFTIGLDRSLELLSIAQFAGNQRREVFLGDALQSCWKTGIFDYAFSIATIHHLSTPGRRQEAVKRLLQCVKPSGGRILIYVWAADQDETSKRSMPDLHDPSGGVDAFVPWVLASSNTVSDSTRQIFNRYYHFFAPGELYQLTCEAAKSLGLTIGPPSSSGSLGMEIVRDGYEKSNWFIELKLWSMDPLIDH